MPERSPMDQLDLAIDALFARRASPDLDAEAAQLAELAPMLRDLPRQEFRAQLKSKLMGGQDMPATARVSKKQPAKKPTGHPTVVPYIAVVEAREVIDFVKKTFGATGSIKGTGSQGGIHSEYRIGDATVMIGGGREWRNPDPRPVYLHAYVEDADAAYTRAMAAGATSISPPADRPYGDREAGVKDPGGNTWFIGQLRNRTRPEGLRDVTLTFEAHDAAAFIDFLKAAFAADEVLRHEEPAGTVRHAQVRVGDTIVEIGEARPEWPPLPTTIFLTVPDCEGTYARALSAGAKSISEPQDTPYGLHMATVEDPFGFTWYITTPPTKKASRGQR